MTGWNAHARTDPAPHRFVGTGLGKHICAVCGQEPDSQFHHSGMRDVVGADVTQCPGCEDIWPIELTVRMMRFVDKRGVERTGRNIRVCQPCAGMPCDAWALLALRRDRGFMTEERYLEAVEELAKDAMDNPRPLPPQCGHDHCTRERGHEGGHRRILVKENQKR